uniref:Uncharacterized protein n=1 Tax=Anguilla anguilla TaxID=7936 RepID=A0A0E9SC42_ANGAN
MKSIPRSASGMAPYSHAKYRACSVMILQCHHMIC